MVFRHNHGSFWQALKKGYIIAAEKFSTQKVPQKAALLMSVILLLGGLIKQGHQTPDGADNYEYAQHTLAEKGQHIHKSFGAELKIEVCHGISSFTGPQWRSR